jgi:hypothetical protein
VHHDFVAVAADLADATHDLVTSEKRISQTSDGRNQTCGTMPPTSQSAWG